jgi:RimJ/RimL family protein N-acetyltransferase
MPHQAAAVSSEVRRLGAEDAEAFCRLRREVTADNPVPMGLSLEEELSRPIEGFRSQLSSPLPNAVFGAFVEGDLAATAAVSRVSHFASSSHKMVMWGVFTSPRHRRRGLGRFLVQHALQHAFNSGARRINLVVYVPNEAALNLYRSLGFIQYGIEREAVYLDGKFADGVHMSLRREVEGEAHPA